jgi:hypothetical protein
MSKLNLNFKRRQPALMLVGLVSIVLTGCVQLDFVRDYPLAGYPSYSTSSGGGGHAPYSYYSEGLYPRGSYGGYYSYPRGYYPGDYPGGAYYPYSRGLYYAGGNYSPFPDYLFGHNHFGYGCPHPSHRAGYLAPLAPPVATPPVIILPGEPAPRPKAPRGRNGGPVKDWRDVERPAAIINRGSAAVLSPAASMAIPPATTNRAAPVGAGAARGGAAIQSPSVRSPVSTPTRSAPTAAPRAEPGARVSSGPRLLGRAR